MANIVPFESKALPSYLKNVDPASLNTDLFSGGGGGFPVISIKGKTFAIVRDGERTILPNPKDPDSPATSIDVVILKANKGTSKIYYASKYVEGADQKPDCYSPDGVAPAADAQSPQAKTCASCKHNQWGARITEAGKKGKSCQDNKRIAVTTPDQLNEPYLMRVPPASLGALTEYGQFLAKRGVKYNMAVTKISFDPEAATPKLVFKAIGLLDEEGYNQVQEALKLDVVEQIVGGGHFDDVPQLSAPSGDAATAASAAIAKASKDKTVTPAEVAAAVAAAEPVAKAAAPAAAEPEVEVDLDNLSFDD